MTEEATTPPEEAAAASEGSSAEETPRETAAAESPVSAGPSQYWLRVHGYVSDLSREVAYYPDFLDLRAGPLAGDPKQHLLDGDVIIFYADGPGAIYGVGSVAGEVEGPLPDTRR